MMICKSCGTQAVSSALKCPACGADSFYYVCESCGTTFESLYCPQCGTMRDAHEKVCPRCGRHSFAARCPDCGTSLRNVAPLRTDPPASSYTVLTREPACPPDETAPKAPVKKRAGAVSVAGMVLSLLGFWSAGDIGIAALTFLIPAGLLLLTGWAVVIPHNRRVWPLVAGMALFTLGIITMLFYPGGKTA
ncbi:MAG: hypothetical protein ABFC31_01745 [Clostridiaceae bacterium]